MEEWRMRKQAAEKEEEETTQQNSGRTLWEQRVYDTFVENQWSLEETQDNLLSEVNTQQI